MIIQRGCIWLVTDFLVFFIICIAHTESLEFLTQPNNITVLNGTEVEFSCVAVEADILIFFVDGIAATEQSVIDKGFIQLGTEDIDATTRRANLTATALTQYNNTKIQCVAIDTGNVKQLFSDNGTLLVQGPLSSVVDITHKLIDSSSLNISWNPPFTLPGTHITGYNISVTSIMFNISQFITDTYYVLTASNSTEPCDEISITVSSYNGAGNGEMANISSLYFPSVSSVNSSIPVTIQQVVTDNMVEITVLLNVSTLCPGEYPNTTHILITNSTDDTTFTNIMLMEGSQDNILTTVDTITLQSDMGYTMQVSFSSLDGVFNITSSTNFTTYDVQSIDITSTSGEVCVVCRFSTNTIAVGCELQIFQNNIMILPAERFNRDVNNIAVGCISNIITGYYDLYVYDVENDNTLSQLPAIIKNDVFVDEQTTTTTTTTTITTTTTGSIITVSTISTTMTTTVTTGTTTTGITTTALASSSLILSSRPSTITSTTGLTTVMSTSGIPDAESNTTIIIATSSSVIILVLIIVTSVLVIIILYSKIHKHSGSTGQVLPLQTNPAYDDPRAVTNTSDRNSNKKISVNKNPAYQDMHFIQTNTPGYENVQQTTTHGYETVM